jgi:hypothetical protein
MPEPITMGALFLAAQAAHKGFHKAHPHICKALHKLAQQGFGLGVKELVKKIDK